MKSRLLSFVLALLALPLVGKATEPTFFSQQGQYTLSPETTLTISADESSHQPKARLSSTNGIGVGVTLPTEHPGAPFLVYWDTATLTLWWGTSQSVGYLDIHATPSGAIYSRPLSGPVHADPSRPAPALFTAELERAVPVHP